MANPTYYGKIVNQASEMTGRETSWAETKTLTFKIIGKYKELNEWNVKPGDSVTQLNFYKTTSIESDVYVRTVTLSEEEGAVGEMTITAVKCPNGSTQPYNIVWESSMDEVQMNLISHPKIQENCDTGVLQKWLDTPARERMSGSGSDIKFWYTTGEVEGGVAEKIEITGDYEIKFCKAYTAGIETYNKYLPVVSKTSYYLLLPGVTYDASHIATSGTITMTDKGKIGTFDEPDVKPSCTPGTKDGKWFKSMDKVVENADGTCTRTEQWTFTNDTTHEWIYES